MTLQLKKIRTGVNTHESAMVVLNMTPTGLVRVSSLYSMDRRAGHARALMERVLEWADNSGYSLILEVGRYGQPVGPDNDVLVRFYESLGFEKIDKENPREKIVMLRHFA